MSGHDDTLYACACAFLARCGEFLSSGSSNIEALDRATNVCIRRSDYIVRDLDRSSREIPANHTAAQQPSHQSHYSLVPETWRRNSFGCAILSNVSTVPPVPRTNTLPPFSCLQLSQFAGEGAGRASRVFNLLQLTWPAHPRSTQQSPVDPRYNCYSESTLAARARK